MGASGTTRPEPPPDIEGEALAEWNRICSDLEAAGRRLLPADRSILATYVRTWSVSQDCYRNVRKDGPVMTHLNGTRGPTPEYKTFRETVSMLRGLLADLGATPASRNFDQVEDDHETELEF